MRKTRRIFALTMGVCMVVIGCAGCTKDIVTVEDKSLVVSSAEKVEFDPLTEEDKPLAQSTQLADRLKETLEKMEKIDTADVKLAEDSKSVEIVITQNGSVGLSVAEELLIKQLVSNAVGGLSNDAVTITTKK